MSTTIPTVAGRALAPNVAEHFRARVRASSGREAFRYPSGDTWVSMTWAATGRAVDRLAAGLIAIGLEDEDRVGIISMTRYEWILADLAVMCAGGATTTVYPSMTAEDAAYILADSGCRVAVVEDDEQLAKVLAHVADLPALRTIVTIAASEREADVTAAPSSNRRSLRSEEHDGRKDRRLGDEYARAAAAGTVSPNIITFEELASLGETLLDERPELIAEKSAAIRPDQLATLIYTSGTTGRPKGVRLRHSSWVYEGEALASLGFLRADDVNFLWLPMAHSFGKVVISAQLAAGFTSAIDGRVDRIIDNLAIVKPTFMAAAPRIFERAYGRIVTMVEAEGGVRQKLFTTAFTVGREVDRLEREGANVPLGLKLQHRLFDRLVFAKIRHRFGGNVRFFISGSAALNREIAEWFEAAGIRIVEGYGLTETSAGASVGHPDHVRFGTVGQALPGSEVRLGDDDEIFVRGPHIMEGYHNRADDTAAVLDADGWLRTGDQGSLDADGYLTITGRLKDLISNSTGKIVAPGAIEASFKALCPYTSQILVFGDDHPYCIALITLDPGAMTGWAAEKPELAGLDYAAIVNSDAAQQMVAGYIDQLNAGLNPWEQVKRWRVLDADLSIESGELTPSMKVRRGIVEAAQRETIEELYA